MKCFSTRSKIQFPLRTLALAFVLTSLVSACMKPGARSPDPNADFSDPTKANINQSTATFVNFEVKGSSSVSMNMAGFSIPTERLFNFKTCVIDKRTQEKIKGHKFNIVGAPGPIVVANGGRSDADGCVNWSEKLAYNGVGDAKWLPIKRTLVADGMHTGARELNLCINPWDISGNDSVRDCAQNAVPTEQLAKPEEIPFLLNAQTKTGTPLERHLWVNDMRINSTHNPGGTQFGVIDFSVSMGPKILRYNVRGEEDPLPLADGVFGMDFWVIAKTGDANNKCYVIAKSGTNESLKMVGGRLQNEMKLKVQYLSTYGQLELVGSIQPRDNGLNVAPFSGVWMLGDHTGLLGMKFAFERPLTYKGEPGSFDARKYAAACDDVSGGAVSMESRMAPVVSSTSPRVTALPGATLTPSGKTIVAPDLMTNECVDASDIPRLFPQDAFARDFRSNNDLLSCVNKNLPSGIARLVQFKFGLVVVKPEPIVDPIETETTTERTIKYSVTTLVKNPLTDLPLRDIEFKVHKSDGSVDTVRTTEDGLLIYTDKIHHVYFEPERYMLKLTQITHSSGFSKHLAIVFNPWDNNGFTFARDLRQVTKQTVAQVNLVPRPKSELLLTSFQWGTQGFRYEVDDFLNLKMFKQFNLALKPRVLRYSSLTEGRMKNEPLRDGIYLMKVAIQKHYRPIDGESAEFVTAIRKLVRVVSGEIIEPVEMAFRDLRVVKLRANLMIELTTIDEAKLSPEQRRKREYDGPLDSLIEKNSGLPSRTFIGPVVAYSNGFSSSIRPTDDLSESYCKTIDCDELKKNDPLPPSEFTDEAIFSGSIKPLANKSVSDMILRQEALEKQYRARTTTAAKLSRLLNDENLEYGAVVNEPAILNQDSPLQTNNKVLKSGNGFADLVKRMSSIDAQASFGTTAAEQLPQLYKRVAPKAELDVAGFKEVLFGNKPLTRDIAARLCVVFVEDVILQQSAKAEESLSYFDRVKARASRMLLNDECMRSVLRTSAGGPEPVINVERKLRIFQLADSKRRGGNLMSLSTGAGSAFSMNRSESWTFGWSPASTVFGLLKGAGFKFLDVLGVSVNVSRSSSKSISQDTGVDSKQTLAVEIRGMRLTLAQYERCASIRLSQPFIEEQFHVLNRAIPQNISFGDRLNRMRRGLFLCEGQVNKKPMEVDERYYMFSQMIGDEAMNDPTALENHPYLMGLRGRPDFARMITMIEARPRSLGDLNEKEMINIGEVPIQRLTSVFKSPMPTFPGILTIEPDSIVQAAPLHKIAPPK